MAQNQRRNYVFRPKRCEIEAAILSVLEGDLTLDVWLLAYWGDETVDAASLTTLIPVSTGTE